MNQAKEQRPVQRQPESETQEAAEGPYEDRRAQTAVQRRIAAAADARPGILQFMGRQPLPNPPVVQRVDEVTIAGVASTNADLNARLRARKAAFHGEMWFNTPEEANAYAGGTAEAMGVWNSEWINLAGVGTIVFGEEHNDIREELVDALNIRHRLIEGASERSMEGVAAANIPAGGGAHGKYTGGTQFKALENYWLRAGQYMARFAAPTIKALRLFADAAEETEHTGKASDAWVPEVERPGELLELIRTLRGATVPDPAPAATAPQRAVIAALSNAQHYAMRCEDFGVVELAQAAGTRYGHVLLMQDMGARKADLLHRSFALLSDAVEELGTAQFRATASPAEIEADTARVAATNAKRGRGEEVTGFEVWSPRRDVAMLANMREALTKDPRPTLISMGAEHARRRRETIEGMPGVARLVIGAITDLLALGRR